MKNRFLAILMACVLACSVFAIAGCGGGSSSSGSSAAPSGPTDEELITADVEGIFGKIFTPEVIEAIISEGAGDTLGQLESLGVTFDYNALAEAFKTVMKVEVTGVTVNGNEATADITITYPDYNDAKGKEAMEAAMTKMLEDVDPATVKDDPDALSKLLNEAIVVGLTSPDIPTTSATDSIEYVKNGDTWEMKDADALQDALKEFGV